MTAPAPAIDGQRRPRQRADELASALLAQDRATLARCITLIESRRPDRAGLGQAVLRRVMPRTGGAIRIGVTGAPGVGKSTLLEALGIRLTAIGRRVAVLAIDPTSARTGGAILGDKTRMPRLAADPRAFVRPSPTSGVLGGVARATREAMLLCEAAGYDVVFVETVGVGQSETAVASMVDTFLVLVLPGGGDELQGIKKGVVEFADLIAVTKADAEHDLLASQAVGYYQAALRVIADERSPWRPEILKVSALSGAGLERLWERLLAHRASLAAGGLLAAKREAQNLRWFESLLDEGLHGLLRRLPATEAAIRAAERAVAEGREAPGAAADQVLDELRRRLGVPTGEERQRGRRAELEGES
jgi:LAO/AO transport system kinase